MSDEDDKLKGIGLKVLDFKKKTEEEGATPKTKYDFQFEGKEFFFKYKIYNNGILIAFVHEVEINFMGHAMAKSMQDFSQKFICLSGFEKFLNFFGKKLTVEDKAQKAIPLLKDSSIEELKDNKVMENRKKEFGETLK